MPDIDINYDDISQAATLLNNAANNTIAPELTTLRTKVDSLLKDGGGLYMMQTSPAIWSQYEQFDSSAQQCVAAINSFAGMFNSLVSNMQSMDGKLAYNILHPSGS
jgi:cytochrome c556